MSLAKVLVSSCLLGAPVRYHGGSAQADSVVLRRWQDEGRVVALCPEVAGGLSTPRPPAELQHGDGDRVLDGAAVVLTRQGEDVTAAFLSGASQAVAAAGAADVRVAVLKSGSPSCAVKEIYDGSFSGRRVAARGVTAAALRRAGIQVFDETQFAEADAVLRALDSVVTLLETPRLTLREVAPDDAAFIFTLVNEPSFLRHIGDKGVRSLDDARAYIESGPRASYARFGFGLYLVELKGPGLPIGLCGLLKRDALDDVDIGFAFLPAYWSQGYAAEAARAVLVHARLTLGLRRIVAVTASGNDRSIRLLGTLGFAFERMVTLNELAPELKLFATALSSARQGGADS